jgi:excisionase family DNA binding protein
VTASTEPGVAVSGSAPMRTPKQVAAQLGVSPSSVRRWLADDRIEGVRIGGRLWVPPEAVKRAVRPASESRC